MGGESGGWTKNMKELRGTNLLLQNSHGDNIQHREYSSQIIYMHDLWTWTMVWGWPERVGESGCQGSKGVKLEQL